MMTPIFSTTLAAMGLAAIGGAALAQAPAPPDEKLSNAYTGKAYSP
jgi:hypothetical protein